MKFDIGRSFISYFKIIAVIFAVACFFLPSILFATQSSVNVNLSVEGCNNNGICEPFLGENTLSCPLDCPLVEPSTEPPSQSNSTLLYPLAIQNILVQSRENSVRVTWFTNKPAVSSIVWGKTADVNDGIIQGSQYSTYHFTEINNLDSDTTYHFRIEVTDATSAQAVASGKFVTLGPVVRPLPPNVLYFTATPRDTHIALKWTNPQPSLFQGVRIVRLDSRFSSSPNEGKVLYEGSLSEFLDFDVVAGKTYYYTIFARYASGEYSSGAIARATFRVPPTDPLDGTPGEGIPYERDPYFGDFLEQSREAVSAGLRAFLASDIIFIQKGILMMPKLDLVRLSEDEETIVTIQDRFKEREVASIIFHLSNLKNGYSVGYFMRHDPETGRYEALIPGLEAGEYRFRAIFLDQYQRVLRDVPGRVIFEPAGLPTSEYDRYHYLFLVVSITAFLSALFLFIFRSRRRKVEWTVNT